MKDTSGTIYGTTIGGGKGTIDKLSMGPAPLVALPSATGSVADSVILLGTQLTGAPVVTSNGVPAKFRVNSAAHQITVKVPQLATSGLVELITRQGAVHGNRDYTVRYSGAVSCARSLPT